MIAGLLILYKSIYPEQAEWQTHHTAHLRPSLPLCDPALVGMM